MDTPRGRRSNAPPPIPGARRFRLVRRSAGECFIQECVVLLHRLFLSDAVALLNAADNVVATALRHGQVVVGEFSPLLLDLSLHWLPVAFHPLLVHLVLPYVILLRRFYPIVR